MAKPLLDVLRNKGVIGGPAAAVTVNMMDIAPQDVQIFVLSPEVAVAAEVLVRSKSFKMPNITELRLPYENMAVELPLTEAVKKCRSDGVVGTHPISRVGMLIQSDPKHTWVKCTPYWEYEDATLVEPPILTYVMGMPDIGIFPSVYVQAPTSGDKALFQVMPSTCILKAFAKFNVPVEHVNTMLTGPHINTMVGEGIGEIPTLLFACALLLTCKSGVVQTKIPARVPLPGMKLGGKKRKLYAASAYTTLHLAESETVAIDGTISLSSKVTAHYVRGHFKQRTSGIYWWNAFVRGTGAIRKRAAYLVEETA